MVAEMRPDLVVVGAVVAGEAAIERLADLRGAAGEGCRLALLASAPEGRALAVLEAVDVAVHLVWAGLSRDALRLALGLALAGDYYAASGAVKRVFLNDRGCPTSPRLGAPRLSGRDRSILRALVANRTRAEVAQEHGVSEHTVNRLVFRLEHELGEPDRLNQLALGAKLAELGLLG